MRTPLLLTGCLFSFACLASPPAAPSKDAVGPAKADKVPDAPAKAADGAAKAPRKIALQVTSDGFSPSSVPLKKGEAVRLAVTRVSDETCAQDLLIEGTSIKVALPLNKTVEVDYTPTKAGKIKFGCAMNMMVSGVLVVD